MEVNIEEDGETTKSLLLESSGPEKELRHASQKRIIWVLQFGMYMNEDYYENVTDVRNSTLSIHMKRTLLSKLREKNPSLEEASLGNKSLEYKRVDTRASRWKRRLFYRSKIQEAIEGRYGSSVYSVFKLIKWVSTLNFLNALIIFFLIYLPHELKNRKESGSLNGSLCHLYENRYVESSIASYCCSQSYANSSSEAWSFFGESSVLKGSSLWEKSIRFFQDLIQGTNWLSFSPLFYGYYEGTYKFKIGNGTYDFPLAYFLVMLLIFLINLFALVHSSSRSFKFKRRERSLSPLNTVFTGWNHYDVNSQTQKDNLHESFLNFFLLGLEGLDKELLLQNTKKMDRLKHNLLRVFINVVTLLVLVLTGYGVVYLNSEVIPSLLEEHQCNVESDAPFFTNYACFLTRYLSAFTILVIAVVFPYIFERLVQIENYSHKTSLVVLIARSLVVRLGSLILTYWSLLKAVQCPYLRGCADSSGSVSFGTCPSTLYGINVKACSNEKNTLGACKKSICWETYVGQQIYTLAVLDLAATLAFIFLIDLPRSRLFKKRLSFMGTVEFNIGKNVLDVVDSQTICWLGLFYTPFLSLIIATFNLILYYIKAFYLLKVCTPVFSESKTSSLFKYFLLISFGCCVTVLGITIYTTEPSISCGPFRNVDCSGVYSENTVFCITYDYIIKAIMSQPQQVQRIIFFFGEKIILFTILGLLLIVFYLSNASMISRRKFHSEMKSLRNKLVIENKDLLKAVEENKKKM